ncbi:MAG: hypothetical protein AAFV29_01370, partial [Myxococcota bacterium]
IPDPEARARGKNAHTCRLERRDVRTTASGLGSVDMMGVRKMRTKPRLLHRKGRAAHKIRGVTGSNDRSVRGGPSHSIQPF